MGKLDTGKEVTWGFYGHSISFFMKEVFARSPCHSKEIRKENESCKQTLSEPIKIRLTLAYTH